LADTEARLAAAQKQLAITAQRAQSLEAALDRHFGAHADVLTQASSDLVTLSSDQGAVRVGACADSGCGTPRSPWVRRCLVSAVAR